jgi:hypothetical protein
MLLHFDIKNAVCYIGSYTIASFADGEAVSVELDDENFTLVKGTNGELIRIGKNNNSATAKVRLNEGNEANQYLSILETADRQTGAGAVGFRFVDFNGGGTVSAVQAYIKKLPSMSWGTEGSVREWEFVLANPEIKDSSLLPA